MYPSTRENNSSKLLSNLNSQRMSGKFCDVSLNIGKSCHTMHSCVLAACCPSILDWENCIDCSFNDPLILRFADIMDCDDNYVDCPECASKVIEFMYLGNIKFHKEHLKHVEALGKFLELSNLLLECELLNKTSANDLLLTNSPNDKKTTCDNIVVPTAGASLFTSVTALPHNHTSSNNCIISFPARVDENTAQSNILAHNDPPVEPDPPDPFSCSKCNLKFLNSIELRQHRETHLGKIYTCYTCKYASQKAFNLIKHLLESNHNEKICSLCMLEADNPENLKIHLEQHNHPKPFFCTICNLRFPTRAGLNIHTPKHSSETPFLCSICNRGFKWKHNLQSHMVVHTTEKKHLCYQCGFSTAHKSTFSAHELTHTGFTFKCPLPGCKFISVLKRNVQNHLATHNKEKMYQCEVCGQSFSQSKNLRRHAIKHDSTADFACCPLCLFKTMRYDKLKEHFKKHHPESDATLVPLKKKKSNATNVPIPVLNLEPTSCIPVELSIPDEISSIFVPNNFILLPVLPIVDAITDLSEGQYSPIDLTTTEILEPEPDEMC